MKKDINKIVLEYVKSQKVNVLLRHTELEEDIHVSIFDFIGKDDKYHSIFICYNDTRIVNTSDTMLSWLIWRIAIVFSTQEKIG